MEKEITLPNGLKATPTELNNQLKNIDSQKLLDSVPSIHYNFQQTPIPKTKNPMVKEQQKLTKEVIELQNKLDNATLQLVESNTKIEEQNNQIAELKNQLKETGIDKAKHKISDIIVGALGGVLTAVILYFIAKFLGVSL